MPNLYRFVAQTRAIKAVLILVAVMFGVILCGTADGQTRQTYRNITNSLGDVVFRLDLYGSGSQYKTDTYEDGTGNSFGNDSARDFTDDEIDALVRALQYWTEVISPDTAPVDTVVIRAGISPDTSYNAAAWSVMSGTVTPAYQILGQGTSTPLVNSGVTGDTVSGFHALMKFNDVDRGFAPSTQLREAIRSLEATMIHEFGHAMGISGGVANWNNLLAGATGNQVFTGSKASSVYGDGNAIIYVPMAHASSQESSHFGLQNGLMTHQQFRNYSGFMEVELAALIDIGYNVDLRNFFGRSVYTNGKTILNQTGFFATDGSNSGLTDSNYLTGQYNTASHGLGLHIYGNRNTVTQQADLLSMGSSGGGIRVDGFDNTITVDTNIKVHANGDGGTGLLVAFGTGHHIIHRGEIEANGVGIPEYGLATGVRFDFGPAYTGNGAPYDSAKSYGYVKDLDGQDVSLDGALVDQFDITGSISGTDAAIYISDNAHVAVINIMDDHIGSDTAISGDIISNYTDGGRTTTLTFGKLANSTSGIAEETGGMFSSDTNFNFTYSGNIIGDGKFDIEAWGRYTWLAGDLTSIQDIRVKSNAELNLAGGGTIEIPGDVTIEQNGVLTGVDNERSLTVTGDVDNEGTLKLFNKVNGNTITNSGIIQDNITVVASSSIDNLSGGVIENTYEVGANKITNAGTIRNNSTVESTTSIENQTGGVIEDNYKVKGNEITNAGTIRNNSTVESTTSIENQTGGVIENTYKVKGNTITNSGTIWNNSTVESTTSIENQTGGVIGNTYEVVANKITNSGTIWNNLTVESTTSIENRTDGVIGNTYEVGANTITNAGIIQYNTTVWSTMSIENKEDGVIEYTAALLYAGTSLTNKGIIQYNTYIETGADLTNATGAIIQGSANIDIGRDIQNNGTIQNNTNIKTRADLTNAAGAIIQDSVNIVIGRDIQNNGTIQNNTNIETGTDLTNTAGAIIQGSANIVIGRDIRNYGTISNNLSIIDVGRDLINNAGTFDGFMTLRVHRNIENSPSGYINFADVSTATIGGNVANNGDIIANGNLTVAGSFTNAAGSSLDGIGTIATAQGFSNRGTISPGGTGAIGTLTIAGQFANPNGEFNIELNTAYYPNTPIAGVNNDVVNVVDNAPGDAIATVDGGIVNFTAPSNDKSITTLPARYVGDSHYIFLDTPDYRRLFVNVNAELTVRPDPDDILLFDFLSGYDTKSYWLDVQREYYYDTYGDTINQKSVGTYIDVTGLDPNPLGDFFDVLVALDKLNVGIPHRDGISQAAKYALDQMSGAIYGTRVTASIQNTAIVNNTLADYLRRGTGAGFDFDFDGTVVEYSKKCHIWALGFLTGGTPLSDGNAYGYSQSFSGSIIGADRYFSSEKFRFGVFASYGQGEISSDLIEKSKSEEFLAGLYFKQDCKKGYFMMNGGIGYHSYDTKRTISFMGRQTKNEQDTFLGTIHLERGFVFGGEFVKFQPFFGTQYVGMEQTEVTESGAGSLNLVGDASDSHSLRSILGCRVHFNTTSPLTYFGNVVWQYEFFQPYTKFTAQFSNPNHVNFSSDTKFTVRGNDPGRDWVILGGGLNYKKNQWSLFAGYDLYMNKNQSLHNGNIGFVFGW